MDLFAVALVVFDQLQNFDFQTEYLGHELHDFFVNDKRGVAELHGLVDEFFPFDLSGFEAVERAGEEELEGL